MKILMIEDDVNKFRSIEEFFCDKFINSELMLKTSYHSGIKELLKNSYDLIILDMSLPTYEISKSEFGGNVRAFGGKDIILQMMRYKIEIPIIVVTQFEMFGHEKITLQELESDLFELNKKIFRGIVYYNMTSNLWKEKLYNKIMNIGGLN